MLHMGKISSMYIFTQFNVFGMNSVEYIFFTTAKSYRSFSYIKYFIYALFNNNIRAFIKTYCFDKIFN